jgi:hypothetical protein
MTGIATNVPKNPQKTRTTEELSGVTPIGSGSRFVRIVAEYKDKRLMPVV